MPRMKLVCDHCGKKYESYQKGKNFHFCSIECRRKAGKLVASAFSKETRDQKSKQFTEMNQTLLNQPEYIEKSRLTKKRIKPTKGYSKYYGRHEHRVVAEQKLGRKLKKARWSTTLTETKRTITPTTCRSWLTQNTHVYTQKKGGQTLNLKGVMPNGNLIPTPRNSIGSHENE